jgi:Fur family ferric uptake transcriptional regulator
LGAALLANDLEKAAKRAIDTLRALGYQDMHFDLAVRGVCADCANANADTSDAGLTP